MNTHLPAARLRAAAIRGTAAVSLLALALWACPLAQSQTISRGRLILTEADVWSYAESLFRDGEYYRAISEYKRLIHFFPASELRAPARLRIGEAYLNGGEAALAVDHFGVLLGDPAMAAFRAEGLFLRGLGQLELRREQPYSLREDTIAAALDDLRAIPPQWPGRSAVDGFVQAMEEPGDVPSKSPWLAAGLSVVIPGAGSAYVGRYAEGALALFVNAVFIYATVNAFEKDNDDLGVVLGVAALAFYGGAIYAAANGAHKFNDRARAAYLDRQRARFGIVVRRAGISGILERRF